MANTTTVVVHCAMCAESRVNHEQRVQRCTRKARVCVVEVAIAAEEHAFVHCVEAGVQLLLRSISRACVPHTYYACALQCVPPRSDI